jgi:hypothetical protein
MSDKKLQLFIQYRKKALEFLGMKDFKLLNKKYSPGPEPRMDFWGSYTSVKSGKVNYQEIHIWKKNRKVELFYSMPFKVSKTLNQEHLKPILKSTLKSLNYN